MTSIFKHNESQNKSCMFFKGDKYSPHIISFHHILSYTNQLFTDCHDNAEILLKVALNTINLSQQIYMYIYIQFFSLEKGEIHLGHY
jgi:hypothetical protein